MYWSFNTKEVKKENCDSTQLSSAQLSSAQPNSTQLNPTQLNFKREIERQNYLIS
jgi:hypothetical protein